MLTKLAKSVKATLRRPFKKLPVSFQAKIRGPILQVTMIARKLRDPGDLGERLILADNIESIKSKNWTVMAHVVRYKWVLPLLTGMFCLDDGCGSGYGTAFLARNGVRIVGVDKSSKAIRYAKRHYRSDGSEFRCVNCTKLEFDTGSFDAVISFDLFEHLTYDEQVKFLSEAHRVMKPGGVLYVGTPNRAFFPHLGHEFNPHHKNIVNFQEFRALVELYFPNASYFAQDVMENSKRLKERVSEEYAQSERSIDEAKLIFVPDDSDGFGFIGVCKKPSI